MKLIATKNRRYATRALRAGDQFDASRADARVLIAVGHAVPDKGTYQTKAAAKASPSNIDTLRAEYQTLTGRAADNRWREPRLTDEIQKARS